MTPPKGSNYNNTTSSKQGKGGGGGRKGRGGGGGGMTSLAIPPRPASTPPHPNISGNKKQPRGQGSTTVTGHPKSKQVIQIEKLLKALHESSSSGGKAKDPKGGCFCLGEWFRAARAAVHLQRFYFFMNENGMLCSFIFFFI